MKTIFGVLLVLCIVALAVDARGGRGGRRGGGRGRGRGGGRGRGRPAPTPAPVCNWCFTPDRCYSPADTTPNAACVDCLTTTCARDLHDPYGSKLGLDCFERQWTRTCSAQCGAFNQTRFDACHDCLDICHEKIGNTSPPPVVCKSNFQNRNPCASCNTPTSCYNSTELWSMLGGHWRCARSVYWSCFRTLLLCFINRFSVITKKSKIL
ncbi:uncharacterized protein LOC144749623 [Ciona intestinalis]